MKPQGSLPNSQMAATCPYPELDISSPGLPIQLSVRSILILYFHVSLGPPSDLFPSGLQQNPVSNSPVSHTCHMRRPSHSSRFDHSHDIWLVQIFMICTHQISCESSPLPCYLVSLRLKYPPQHSIRKLPQPMFLRQCDRPDLRKNEFFKISQMFGTILLSSDRS